MQITLYHDGRIRYSGRTPGDLGEILRLLAVAADEGAIKWTDEESG